MTSIDTQTKTPVTIDPSTGLPALPEGHVFVVDGVSVKIVKLAAEKTVIEYDTYKGKYTLVSLLKARTNLQTQIENHYRDPELTVENVKLKTYDNIFKHDHTKLTVVAFEDETVYSGYSKNGGLLTPKKLLKTAKSVYREWKRRAEHDALQGVYPPKKLELANTTPVV